MKDAGLKVSFRRHNIASPEEIDIDTLVSLLQEERKRTGAAFIRDMAFGISARKNFTNA